MHPAALHSGRQLSTQLGTAGGAGCGLSSGSLPAACTAGLWTGVYNSSPSSTQSLQPRKLRSRPSKVFQCLAPVTCLHNLRGWGLHNLLSIIWEVCGSPDLTPVGPKFRKQSLLLRQYPINTPKNRRRDVPAQTKGPPWPLSSRLHSSQEHISGQTYRDRQSRVTPPPAPSQPLPLAAQGLQAEAATPYSAALCRLLSDELIPFPLEPR